MSNLAEMPVRVKVQTLDEFWNERYCEVSRELLKHKLALAAHKCSNHLQSREATSTEPHGEHFEDEWYECGRCGERFSQAQAEALFELEDYEQPRSTK